MPGAFKLPDGRPVARLGQGTWNMGDRPVQRRTELDALRTGLDLGLALIDTAEMYGNGRSEQLVGEALAGRRAEAYLVSKVLPGNATRRGTVAACERSLKRLGTDYLDLYLLHWRQSEPLDETLEGFLALQQAGKVRAYGVSNFDVDDLIECAALSGGAAIATDQVLYNLENRGIEWDLLPWCNERSVDVMAYSPLGSVSGVQGLLSHRVLRAVADRRGVTAAQVALAWVLRRPGVLVIPKAASASHVRENAHALELALSAQDLSDLDRAFPPPRRKTALALI